MRILALIAALFWCAAAHGAVFPWIRLPNMATSRSAFIDSNGYLTNDVASTGTDAPVRANSPTITNATLTGTVSAGIVNTTGAITGGSTIMSSAGTSIGINTRSRLSSAVNGNLAIANAAQNDFGILQFGSTGATFPGIMRNGTGLEIVLANGSATTTIGASAFRGGDATGSDVAGTNAVLRGGLSTGTARGGAAIISTANSAGASSSTANSTSERFHAVPKWVTLTSASATTLFTIPVPSTNYVGMTATITVYATDGTDHQSKTSVVTVDAIAKTTTITTTISQVDNTTAASSGTLTATYTAVDNTSNVMAVKCEANSSLTETVLRAKIVITAINSNGTAVVTEI